MVKGKESIGITIMAKGKRVLAYPVIPVGWTETPPSGQKPSPSRTPTGTSKRAGSGQGDFPHTKETTSASRMHGDHKEQHLFSQLEQMETKASSSTQTSRNVNRE